MYSRNCGSNWPRSWAPIARSTRGSALIGPGPIRRRGAGLRSSAMRMQLQPMARDVEATRDPGLLGSDVFQEALERRRAARPADEPAVQAHRHHAPAFRVQDIERVLQVVEEIVARVEALGRREAHVV